MPPQVEVVLQQEPEEEPQQQQLQNDQQRIFELSSALEGMRLQMCDAESQMQKLAELAEKTKLERQVMELSSTIEELRRQISNMQKSTQQQISNMHKDMRQQAARHHNEKIQWQAERQFIMGQLKRLQTVQSTGTIPQESQPNKQEQTSEQHLASQPRIAAPVPNWLHQKIMQERMQKPRRITPTPILNSFAFCQKSLRDCSESKCNVHSWVLKSNTSVMENNSKSQENIEQQKPRRITPTPIAKSLRDCFDSNVGQKIIPNRDLLRRYHLNLIPNHNLVQVSQMSSDNINASVSNAMMQGLVCGGQNAATNVASSVNTDKTSQAQSGCDINAPITNLNQTSNGSEIEKYKQAIYQAGIDMQDELRVCETEEEKVKIMAKYEKAMNENIAALGYLAIRCETKE